MIDLYYWPTPNGWKISIMLEECGLPYKLIPVNSGTGEQFKPAFLKIDIALVPKLHGVSARHWYRGSGAGAF
jgi:glutathione S-transferase